MTFTDIITFVLFDPLSFICLFTSLSLLPVALDGARLSYPWIPRLPFALTNYSLFVMTNTFISVGVYVWATEWLTYYIKSGPSANALLLHLIVGSFICVNVLSHLNATHLVGPGWYHGLGRALPPSTRRHCRHCDQDVPQDTHHCRICNVCVHEFDHHCPFVAGCVGRDNKGHFFWFASYLAMGCTYAVVLAYDVFTTCVLSEVGSQTVACLRLQRNAYLFLPFFLVWLLSLLLLGWQAYLVYADTTTFNMVKLVAASPLPFTRTIAQKAGSTSNFWRFFEGKEDVWMIILFPWMAFPLGLLGADHPEHGQKRPAPIDSERVVLYVD